MSVAGPMWAVDQRRLVAPACASVGAGGLRGAAIRLAWAPIPPLPPLRRHLLEVLRKRLALEDCQANGWLLDGFPHTAEQAAALKGMGIQPDKVRASAHCCMHLHVYACPWACVCTCVRAHAFVHLPPARAESMRGSFVFGWGAGRGGCVVPALAVLM